MKYRENRKPAEEYKLVQKWAEALKLDKYFKLIDEKEYRARQSGIDSLTETIGKDPYVFGMSEDYSKKLEMDQFQKTQKAADTNMAVVMFMVDALQYFKEMPKEKIKVIAHEIALQGTQGYRPDKTDYSLNSIPNKIFSGYHILAYYYVSWMLAAPEMVPELHLPFDEEYNLALTLYKAPDKS